jgi:limonene-1,2-epoxide hydrolase
MITVDDARAVFARRVDAWLTQDVVTYLSCWHDDMRIELPTGVIVGAAAYRTLVEASFDWAAPVSFDVHHFAVDEADGIVFADWTIRARRRDDDELVEWHGLSVCEVRDGRIVWWREHHLRPPVPAAGR